MKLRARQYVCDLTPYQPGLPIDLVARTYGFAPDMIVKLASNENPYGMSPRARHALEQALAEAHRYPEQYALNRALAARYDVDPHMVALGNGSNDVLDLIARSYLGKGDEAISSQFAFIVYQIATQSVGAKNIIVPAKDYGHDLNGMLQAVTPKTKIIWIANPNNPTGTLIPHHELKVFLAKVPSHILLVLDEAYYEYLAPEDRTESTAWLKDYPNLVIVRTFSKAYGLAGLRIGYGIMHSGVAEMLNRVRQPFNGNHVALVAAVAALQDKAFVQRSVRSNQKERELLLAALADMHLTCLPAYGNFVTFKIGNAATINQRLLESGVIVRPLAGYGMHDWLRVTVGLPKENDRFLQALRIALSHDKHNDVTI